ncbi:MAG: NAD(+)/NADH kinase [Christensenellales bacterium]
MRIGIVANAQIENSVRCASELKAWLKGDAEVYIPQSLDDFNVQHSHAHRFFKNVHIACVMGGDGTILSVSRLASTYDVPVLGVNLGRIGYLSEVEISGMRQAITRILSHDYIIDERMMLTTTYDSKRYCALNEFAVTRKQFDSILRLTVSVDGQAFDTMVGDGMLVSTPTGSTGYSLSAGGPIISPQVNGILITPLCSHSLSSRPVMIAPEKQITISPQARGNSSVFLSFDGQMACKVHSPLTIMRSKNTAKFIRFQEFDFFTILNNKLNEKP